jgi:ADP-ribose pyrophosphatase
MNKWNKVSSEEVFSHKYFKVNKDIVELSSGERVEWLYWNSNDSAMLVAETPDNKLVMIRQFRYLPNQTALEFPSGHSDDGESIKKCVVREFEEETGYTCENLQLLGSFYETMGQLNRQIHIFYGNNAKKVAKRSKTGDITEDIEVVLMDKRKAIDLALQNKIISMGSSLAILLVEKVRG